MSLDLKCVESLKTLTPKNEKTNGIMQAKALEFDVSIDEEIRKNYNPGQLVNDIGIIKLEYKFVIVGFSGATITPLRIKPLRFC